MKTLILVAAWLLISLACTTSATLTPPAASTQIAVPQLAPTKSVAYPTLNPDLVRTPETRIMSTSQPTPTEFTTVSTGIEGGALNMRLFPSDDSPIVTTIREGNRVTVRGTPYRGWLPVRYMTLDGYVAVKFTNYYK